MINNARDRARRSPNNSPSLIFILLYSISCHYSSFPLSTRKIVVRAVNNDVFFERSRHSILESGGCYLESNSFQLGSMQPRSLCKTLGRDAAPTSPTSCFYFMCVIVIRIFHGTVLMASAILAPRWSYRFIVMRADVNSRYRIYFT